jgi:acyl-coenzyme A synthetase/AMP-(fatty) acid ligase
VGRADRRGRRHERADSEELRAFARSQLRGAKTPDRIIVREELPRTPLGKLQRGVVLRDVLAVEPA